MIGFSIKFARTGRVSKETFLFFYPLIGILSYLMEMRPRFPRNSSLLMFDKKPKQILLIIQSTSIDRLRDLRCLHLHHHHLDFSIYYRLPFHYAVVLINLGRSLLLNFLVKMDAKSKDHSMPSSSCSSLTSNNRSADGRFLGLFTSAYLMKL